MPNTKTLTYNRPSFLHWEGDPTHSRESLLVTKPVKTGDVLILTGDNSYSPYTSDRVNGSVFGDKTNVAFALENGEEGEYVACVVRNAVVIIDRLNLIKLTDFDANEPLGSTLSDLRTQGIVLRHSIAVNSAELEKTRTANEEKRKSETSSL